MMTSPSATHFKFQLHHLHHRNHHHNHQQPKSKLTLFNKLIKFHPSSNFAPGSCSLLVHSARGGDGETSSQQSSVSNIQQNINDNSSTGDTYLPLLITMLGLHNDILDREDAIVALWKYSLGGRKYIDNIMNFPECVNLTVHLLRSESSQVLEAAFGLLRMISSVNSYRDLVAQSGAIEETTALLRRPSLNSEVKEQSICMLWNLSSDEKYRVKIANITLLPFLIKFLDDEESKVVEAAIGVLANLALTRTNHNIMVEVDVIPKLAKFLTNEVESSNIIKKSARNALLELAKDDHYKTLIIEEGLILVPLVGPAAYSSYKPGLHSWPSLPNGTEFIRSSKRPSRYGANELLLGLNIEDNTDKIDRYKMEAIVGRTQQQFLARIGAIETEVKKEAGFHQTLLPWKDGVARLVLILELEDEMAVIRAANDIAKTPINKDLCVYFREAGAVKHLVYLLDHKSDQVKSAVVNALEKLSVSNAICGTMEAEGAIKPLFNMLKDSNKTETLTEQVMNILSRILDPNKEMKLKFYDGPLNGSMQETDSINSDGNSKHDGNIARMKDMVGPTLIGFFVDTLKTSSSSLQAKAASILEFLIITEQCVDIILSTSIDESLIAIFEQNAPKVMESDVEEDKLECPYDEQACLAISSASRLLTRLLDHNQFHHVIDSDRLTKSLRQILRSNIPLHYKDWVASALIKLTSTQIPFDDNPVTTEVTLYDTIPRLIEKIDISPSLDAQEDAVVQLNRIVSEGVVGATRVVVDKGGVYPLVKLIESGSERAVEAGLAVLYNLSMDGENHSAILAAGAAPVLRRIVVLKQPQWMKALLLLRNLPI